MALDESTEWSYDGYLLARVSDALEASNYMFMCANTSPEEQDKNPIPEPKPIPRPGEPEPSPEEEKTDYEFASGHEVANFFQSMSGL